MSTLDPWIGFDEDLDSLSVYDAGQERVERIRARCLMALSAHAGQRSAEPRRRAAWREWLVPAFALSLSALYLAAAVGTTLRLAGVIHVARALARQ